MSHDPQTRECDALKSPARSVSIFVNIQVDEAGSLGCPDSPAAHRLPSRIVLPKVHSNVRLSKVHGGSKG